MLSAGAPRLPARRRTAASPRRPGLTELAAMAETRRRVDPGARSGRPPRGAGPERLQLGETMLRTAQPLRLAAAAVAFTSVALLLLVAAGAAHAAVWVIPATARAFPGTPPGISQSIAIDAAQNEYEGAQVVLRDGGGHAASFSWSADSDPLIVGNTILDQVYYVNVTQPTTDLKPARRALPGPAGASELRHPDRHPQLHDLVLPAHARPPRHAGRRLSAPRSSCRTAWRPCRSRSACTCGGSAGRSSARAPASASTRRPCAAASRAPGCTGTAPPSATACSSTPTSCSPSTASPRSGHSESPPTSADGTFDAAKYAATLAPYLGANGLDLSARAHPVVALVALVLRSRLRRHQPAARDVSHRAVRHVQAVRLAGQGLRLHHGRDHEALGGEDRGALRPRTPRRLRGLRLSHQVPAHRRPAAAESRRRQAVQRLPLRRRRYLGRALLLLLRAHPRAAAAEGRGQRGLVVHLREQLGGQDPQLRDRETQHGPARLGLAHGALERGRPDELGA